MGLTVKATWKTNNSTQKREIKDVPKILKAYWCDENWQLIKFPHYNERLVYIGLFTNTEAVGQTYSIHFYHQYGIIKNDFLSTNEDITIESTNTLIPIKFDGRVFSNICFNIIDIEFYFWHKNIPANQYNETISFKNAKLKIHAVIFIWEIMEYIKWNIGAKTQHRWFKTPATAIPKKYFDIDNIMKMESILSFPRIKNMYNNLIEKKIWITPKAQLQIVKEIRKMLITGHARLPNKVIKTYPFGCFDNKLIKSMFKDEMLTTIDEYYIQNIQYQQPTVWKILTASNREGVIDDVFAALGDFRIRMTIKGNIEYLDNQYYKININQVGTYIIDSFDFVDNAIFSQPLGFWDIINKKFIFDLKDMKNLHYICNKDYSTYREDTAIGQDYILYSDVKTLFTNDSFVINRREFGTFLEQG